MTATSALAPCPRTRTSPAMPAEEVLGRLRTLAQPAVLRGLARFAIPSHNALDVSAPAVRMLAKEFGRNHLLAVALWKTGILEARCLAALIDEPARVTESQAERWVRDFDSWAVCDQCCFEVFDKTPYAWRKALEWTRRRPEFEKRAGFALMAATARHDRQSPDARFKRLLAVIKRESGDGRNFVRKAVNWALREIGKRNPALNRAAVREARAIRTLGTPSARWIAADALRELTSAAVQARLRARLQSRRTSRLPTRPKPAGGVRVLSR
jgi:3-methyladenine DNA glycosylase AlkD